MNELSLGYKQTEYFQNHQTLSNYGYGVRINYGHGNIEEIDLPTDFGQNEHDVKAIREKCLAYEKRTSQTPEVTFYSYNRKMAQLGRAVELSTFGANTVIACSLLAGFLDRYRITLAARIDGMRAAIGHLSDITKPCAEQLPKALANVERLTKLLEKITPAYLLEATKELTIAKTSKEGLETCANLAQEFTRLVEPMERVNKAMAGEGFATKLQVFLSNIDMSCVKDAMKDYTLGEQSLGFLITVASSVGVGFSVRDAGKAICSNVLNISESKATLAANIAGVAAGLYVATYGDGLLQAAGIGLCAYATKYAARAIGMGIQIFKSCIPRSQ